MSSGELLDNDEDPLQLEPKKRKRSNNEVTIYPCDKREYAATTACDLRRHIKINYEGVSNLSDKHEFTATTPWVIPCEISHPMEVTISDFFEILCAH